MRWRGIKTIEFLLDGGGPFIAWLDEDGRVPRRGLLIRDSICDNPKCDCRDIFLTATLVDERYQDIQLHDGELRYRFFPREGESQPPLRHLAATLDIDTAEIEFDRNASPGLWDPELLAWLKAGTLDPYMDRLRRRWRFAKGTGKDAWRTRDWTWWQPGDMVSWLEVFPDDFNLLFDADGVLYMAEDMYCINPGCSCSEVGLAIYAVTENGMKSVGAMTVKMPSCRFSDLMDDRGDEKTLKHLLASFRQRDFCRVIHDRWKKMGPVGREIVRLSAGKASSANPTGPKVGRNDPCPCGSGKKFKKCCLGKN